MSSQWENHIEPLRMIAKMFYQAYRITGAVKMKFGIRSIADSDGNSVVDVYISPLNAEAASSMATPDSSQHLQLLETMVPAELMGYQFMFNIVSLGTNDIELQQIESSQPFLTVN